jgi:hypothetical protein
VKTQDLGVLFLMETKIEVKGMEQVRVKLGLKNVFVVPSLRRSGGLAMLWKQDTKLEIKKKNFSSHHIDSYITQKDGREWRMTGFYGRPEDHRR